MHDDDAKSGQVFRRLERSTVEDTQVRRNSTGDDDPIPTLAATQAEEADFPTTVCILESPRTKWRETPIPVGSMASRTLVKY